MGKRRRKKLGKGWHHDSRRHALAAQGIETTIQNHVGIVATYDVEIEKRRKQMVAMGDELARARKRRAHERELDLVMRFGDLQDEIRDLQLRKQIVENRRRAR